MDLKAYYVCLCLVAYELKTREMRGGALRKEEWLSNELEINWSTKSKEMRGSRTDRC